MFIDEAEIEVAGGRGGDGCVSFRRERYVPRGGPDGGDGGDGGSVYCVADSSYNTLAHLTGKHHWRAGSGGRGRGKKCHGRNGRDVLVRVPPGTIVNDAEQGTILKDLVASGEMICVGRGGRGGKGNARFATATHQTPREATPGQSGQARRLRLELKLIADVGLIGLPNAGKSTLIRRLSAARPKVAAYPFTTLEPVLGIAELPGERRFVVADIPGLIEGSHLGAGLGDEFLRHIERTTLLVHMVDICPSVGDPLEQYNTICRELIGYSPSLGAKTQIVVANKMDLTGSDESLHRFAKAIGREVIAISAATGRGLRELAEQIWRALHPNEAADN